MKTHSSRFAITSLVIISLSAIFVSGCGQNNKDKKVTDKVEAAKPVDNTPVVNPDTQVTVTPVVTTRTDSVRKPVTDTVKKVTVPVIKPVTVQPTQPVKPAVVNKPDVPATKPVTEPVKPTVPVTKPVTEPVKPTVPDTKPVTEPVKPPVVKEPEPKIVTAENPAPVQDDWIVPAKYKTMANPYPADKENLELGSTLYGTHCKSCHGSKGKGDGAKASTIDTKMRSFLGPEFLAQTPGEIFYKTTFGRKDMPKFEKKIADPEERWALVNYILSLRK